MKRIVISLVYFVAYMGLSAHPISEGIQGEAVGLKAELDARQYAISTTIRKMKDTTAKVVELANAHLMNENGTPTSPRIFSNLLQFSLLSLTTLTEQVRTDSHELLDYTERLRELQKELAHVDTTMEDESTKITLTSLKNEMEKIVNTQRLEVISEQQKTVLTKMEKQKAHLILLQDLLKERSLYQATQVLHNVATNASTLEISTH